MLPGLPHSQAGSYDPLHRKCINMFRMLLDTNDWVILRFFSDTNTHGATVFEVQRRQRETVAWEKEMLRITSTRNTDGPSIVL